MLTPAGLIGRVLERLRAEDPEHDALRRAARAAAQRLMVVVGWPTQTALSEPDVRF